MLVHVQNQDLKWVLRSAGSRSWSALRMVDSDGRAWSASRSVAVRDVGVAVDHPVLVPDLHHHSVQKDHRAERLQRPVLPLSDFVHHGLGDIADGLMGQLSTQCRGEVMLNLTDRHTDPHKG